MTEEPKPTPRTDEAEESHWTEEGYLYADFGNFARQLETELADKDARLTALMESMEARLANIEGNGLMAMTERGCLEKCITELREALGQDKGQ